MKRVTHFLLFDRLEDSEPAHTTQNAADLRALL